MTAARGTLYLVPNALDFGTAGELAPLDNLVPTGVIRIAARLEHWACENARTTRAFLKRVDAIVPLAMALQAVEITELPRSPKGPARTATSATQLQPMEALLAPTAQGHDLGLLSEAGLPALADPGALLVAAAHIAGVRVVALPGASAVSLAIAASGLNGQSFAFVGYLPVEGGARADRIRQLEAHSLRAGQTQAVIETPYRNQALLEALIATLQPQTTLATSLALTVGMERTTSQTVAVWRRSVPALPADLPCVFSFLAR